MDEHHQQAQPKLVYLQRRPSCRIRGKATTKVWITKCAQTCTESVIERFAIIWRHLKA